MRVAVLGTGIMGAPIARNLAAAGHEVRAWNRTPEKADGIDGVEPAADVAEAVRGADAVVTMLSDADDGILHSITSCRAPCNRTTGIAYPLADGPVDFDSGELGFGPQGFTAAANRDTWSTPADLGPGTYTYFCRVHPFMRGAFRVKG